MLAEAVTIRVLGLLLQQAAAIGQNDTAQVARRGTRIDLAAKAVAHQQRQVTAMVQVGMREHDRTDLGRRQRQARPVAQAQLLIPVEQAAIDQNPLIAAGDQIFRTAHRPRRAQKRQFHHRPK